MNDPRMPQRTNAEPPAPAGDGIALQAHADAPAGAEAAPRPGPESEDPAGITEILIRIDSDRAITKAREHARRLGARAGFDAVDRALLVTIVSELGRNILLYAGRGELLVALVADPTRLGVAVTACDDGPGILDVDDALRDGYSTSGRPGLGLPGIKRVCDEFHVSSSPDQGTTVSIKKWRDRQ